MDLKVLVLLLLEKWITTVISWWRTGKGLRAGTEALHQIAGMAKALAISYDNLEHDKQHIGYVLIIRTIRSRICRLSNQRR
jgi:cysteine sulfinate desulfinase/cysteine desulfurase-like protein